MTDDWLLAAIDEVERAADAARSELAAIAEVLVPVRADRVAGAPLVTLAEALASRGAGRRRSVAAAFGEYEHAVAALRAQVVRALIDDEGATVSGLARRIGISRQAVTRLYQAGAKTVRPAGGDERP